MRRMIDKGLEGLLVFLMAFLVVDVLWQVVSRYVLVSPSSVTDELAGYLLIWVGLLGAAYVAADLLAQSEHDPNAKGMLITTDERFGQAVIQAVEKELSWLPTASIAEKSWETYGEVVLTENLEEAVEITNSYAPEHLELNVREPEILKEKLYNYLKSNYGILLT